MQPLGPQVSGHGVIAWIETADHRLMRRVHRWHAPRWVRLWMICATRGGDGWLWYILGAALMLFGGAEGAAAVAQASSAAGAGVAVFIWLKRMTGRRRPCMLEPHCWARLLPPDQFSFPSGHTITAFAVALPVAAHFPEAAPAVWFCAVSIAASRIILGMHFLSDVLAGALLGGALGAAARTIAA
jgi:undecaprenyl-diphosphatase